MAIKGLRQNERSLPRAGIIRLGYKTRFCQNEKCKYKLAYQEADTTKCPRCGGEMSKQAPAEANHFVLKDAPGVAEALGTETPTELRVYFPFDEIDRNFPSYRTLFVASHLACQGDGQSILHATNPTTGQTVVKDGLCILPFFEKMADGKSANHQPGDRMACPAVNEPNIYAKCANCVNSGILLIMLEAVPRKVYFQIATRSIHNLEELPQQMLDVQETIYELTGRRKLAGVPFILRRVLRSMSPLKKDKQGNPIGRMRTEKYTLQLEIEPDFMLRIIRAQRQLVDPMARFLIPARASQPQQPVIEVQEPEAVNFAEPPEWEAPMVEDAEYEEAEMVTDQVSQSEPEALPEPQPQSTNGDKRKKERPLDAQDTYNFLHLKTAGDDGKKATQAQVGLMSGKLEECFAPEKDAKGKRLTVLHWLWQVESAKELTFKQAKATLDWLLNGEQGSDGDHLLHEHAPEEARRVYVEAMRAAGQTEMPIETEATGAPEGQLSLSNDWEDFVGENGSGGAAYSDV